MDLVRQHVGRNTVRVGVTQYPAGLGVLDAGELKPDLVDACTNLQIGTALFAKIYRIVAKWYGNPTAKEVLPQVFDDAVIAWQTGYFEGVAVFRAKDPGDVELPQPEEQDEDSGVGEDGASVGRIDPDPTVTADPNQAGIRIDLSGIGGK